MKARTLLPLALLVFLLSAVLNAPADRLYAWVAARTGAVPVQLQGLSGTLSSGRIAQVQMSGQPLVRDLGWSLRALELLLGRASFHLSGGRDGALVDGTLSLVPSGTLSVRDFRAALPMRELMLLFGASALPVEGQAAVDFADLRLRKGWPQRAEGTLTIRGLGWKLGREPVRLGDYAAQVENETGGVKATVRTLAGALEVSGEARATLEQAYSLRLQMRPRPDAPPMVANLARSFGQPDAQGWYHVQRSGQLAPRAQESAR